MPGDTYGVVSLVAVDVRSRLFPTSRAAFCTCKRSCVQVGRACLVLLALFLSSSIKVCLLSRLVSVFLLSTTRSITCSRLLGVWLLSHVVHPGYTTPPQLTNQSDCSIVFYGDPFI